MYHIGWIGYISQELAYLGRFFIRLVPEAPNQTRTGKAMITQNAS